MAGPKWFEWIIILVSVATLASALISGRPGLARAPLEWREATRESDPGRFWAFVAE